MSKHPSTFTPVVIGNVAALLVSANPKRKGLLVSPHSANRITISSFGNVTDQAGITIHPATELFPFCCCDVGDWVTKDIFAVASAAATPSAIVEVFD